MSKLPRLSKTGIEYGDYGWNFYSGCLHKKQGVCPPAIPCWAGEHTRRFKAVYPNGFAPTVYPEAFLSPLGLKQPSRILVCFMGDLFGDWVDMEHEHTEFIFLGYKSTRSYMGWIKWIIEQCPQHTFIFLTKNPAGMLPWSPFPDNCEVGFTATNPVEFVARFSHLGRVEAKVKWCSLEPLLEWSPYIYFSAFELLDWVAIGGLTGRKGQIEALANKYPQLIPIKLTAKGNRWVLAPPLEWIENIVKACDAAGTKVFLKDNILPLVNYYSPETDFAFDKDVQYRQEMPE